MAEAIDDDVNSSNNKSNITAAAADATTATTATVIAVDGGNGGGGVGAAAVRPAQNANDSGNGDMSFMANNRNANCSVTNNNPNSRRSMQRFSCSRCCNDIFNYLMRFRASPEEMEQRHKSREIDRLLEKDKHTFRRQVNAASQSLFMFYTLFVSTYLSHRVRAVLHNIFTFSALFTF